MNAQFRANLVSYWYANYAKFRAKKSFRAKTHYCCARESTVLWKPYLERWLTITYGDGKTGGLDVVNTCRWGKLEDLKWLPYGEEKRKKLIAINWELSAWKIGEVERSGVPESLIARELKTVLVRNLDTIITRELEIWGTAREPLGLGSCRQTLETHSQSEFSQYTPDII